MTGTALISACASEKIYAGIERLGLSVLKVPETGLVDRRISSHPDIQLFPCLDKIFCHPDVDRKFLSKLERYSETVLCKTGLTMAYPGDIPYNIAFTGTHALHLLKSTDPDIKKYLIEKKIQMIDINQGYSKCSTMILDEKRIITSDSGIHESATMAGLESLKIRSGYIKLDGFDYGFIGGASALFGDTLLLSGHIENHPDKNSIIEFILSADKKIEFLSEDPATDIGSIFII